MNTNTKTKIVTIKANIIHDIIPEHVQESMIELRKNFIKEQKRKYKTRTVTHIFKNAPQYTIKSLTSHSKYLDSTTEMFAKAFGSGSGYGMNCYWNFLSSEQYLAKAMGTIVRLCAGFGESLILIENDKVVASVIASIVGPNDVKFDDNSYVAFGWPIAGDPPTNKWMHDTIEQKLGKEQRYIYVYFLGSLVHGKGFGKMLLQMVLLRANKMKLPVVLDAVDAKVIDLYKSMGFVVVNSANVEYINANKNSKNNSKNTNTNINTNKRCNKFKQVVMLYKQ
jgi:predicted GNAT family acetyltransferase